MCCDKASDSHTNHVCERALRTVYGEKVSTFEKLPEKDSFATTRTRNLKILATELYKTKEILAAPVIMTFSNGGISNINFAHKLIYS